MLLKKKKERKLRSLLKNKHILLVLALLYFIFPIDIIPDAIPAIGFGDDVLVVIAALLYELFKMYYFKKQAGVRAKVSREKEEIVVEGEIIE